MRNKILTATAQPSRGGWGGEACPGFQNQDANHHPYVGDEPTIRRDDMAMPGKGPVRVAGRVRDAGGPVVWMLWLYAGLISF